MRNNGNGIVVGIVAVVLATLVCATAVLLFAPEGTDVAPLIGTLAPTVAALGALAQLQRQGAKLDQVDQRTTELANGLMDAKTRAGAADVLHPDLINPEYATEQLQADRQRRDEGA